jgi:ERCC4-type nuclease
MASMVEEACKDVCDEITYTQLPVGDFLVVTDAGAICVERKTVSDFLSSVRSNRLWEQLLRMIRRETVLEHTIIRRILIIHGTFENYLEHGYHEDFLKFWSQQMGAFMQIVYVYNTPIIHAEDDTAFKAFLRILVKREASGKNDRFPEAKWYRKPAKADLPEKDRKRYILSALPHIGEQLATNLLEHFGTIVGVASASVEDLQKVPKIGKKKAELIYNMFH